MNLKSKFDSLRGLSLDFFNWSSRVAENAIAKGFRTADHPPTVENIAVFVANLHSEVSEFWEAFRASKLTEPCEKAAKMVELGLPPLTCAEEELTDIVIRAMDTAKANGVDLATAIAAKHLYNTTRPEKHGGKQA